MYLYFRFIKNAFLTNSAYRMNVFLRLFNRIMFLFINISIWKALYKGHFTMISNNGDISINDMITYAIISTAISVFINNTVIQRINYKIKTGEISMDLIKPMNFRTSVFCNEIGENCSRIVFELIPVLLISAVLFRINLPELDNFIVFLITLINGMLIQFFITYVLGLLGFWYLEVWHFDRLLDSLMQLFSGALIPLWFFPEFLVKVSNYLPFKLIYFTPISIYLGKFSLIEGVYSIMYQIIWIMLLLIIEKILWKHGIKKLVVQGG